MGLDSHYVRHFTHRQPGGDSYVLVWPNVVDADRCICEVLSSCKRVGGDVLCAGGSNRAFVGLLLN